ncbi:P1 family peptidase [Fusibacter paucivorans]|uniref:P1 family peptidase n=1 Tax=Fusibacter paucivorans TaxID=76009 RepID=A0ABS5PM24_9FIRM|nr:P1 family peptidase [Fusibacter paucivorans]MBS7525957.1 P1 family peptidase [Fusibacter paucivorans]
MNKRKNVIDRLKIGSLQKGAHNLITDVAGVAVGHVTVASNDMQTGVTVVMPTPDNVFVSKCVAASEVINGFGKTLGTIQIEELGQLESPIALTNTLNVGKVSDALVAYMLEACEQESVRLKSFNPIVCECNDSYLNAIEKRVIDEQMVHQAIRSAATVFEEGAVGGGRGMSCHQLKGGIGSSSRQFELDGECYTVGVLVQANYGRMEDLMVAGVPIGSKLRHAIDAQHGIKSENASDHSIDKGSIIIIVATDLPVSHRQLKRMLRRTTVGIARVGGYIGNGSGEIAIGFSTANRIPHEPESSVITVKMLSETKMDMPFRAVAEATEEAVLHALIYADTVVGVEAHYREGLLEALKKYEIEGLA